MTVQTSLLFVFSMLTACLPSEVDCYVAACTSGGGGGGPGPTTTPCGTFGAPRQLVGSTPAPSAVAVDATDVYWIDPSGAYRVSKLSTATVTAPALFASTYAQPADDPDAMCAGKTVAPGALALTPELVLWTLWDHCAPLQPWGPFLWVVPKSKASGMSAWGDGAPPIRDFGLALAVNSKRAYVSAFSQHSQESHVYELDPAVETKAPPFVTTPYDARSLGVSGEWIYFNDTHAVGLFRAPRAMLASAEPVDLAGSVTKVFVDLASGGVFYVSDAKVKRYDEAGAKVTTLAAEAVETPADLTSDASCVYWGLPSGKIRAVPKAGGAAFDLVTSPATSVAADAQGIYWADSASGSIWMLPRAD